MEQTFSTFTSVSSVWGVTSTSAGPPILNVVCSRMGSTMSTSSSPAAAPSAHRTSSEKPSYSCMETSGAKLS